MSNLAYFLMVFRMAFNAVDNMKLGTRARYLAISPHSVLRSVKALSSTMPAMLGSRSACSKAVAAPILLPQSPIVLTLPVFLR